MKVIEVVVSPKGETTIQTKGFAGSDCQQASKFFRRKTDDLACERWGATRFFLEFDRFDFSGRIYLFSIFSMPFCVIDHYSYLKGLESCLQK